MITVKNVNALLVAEIGHAEARKIYTLTPKQAERALCALARIPIDFISPPEQAKALNKHSDIPENRTSPNVEPIT